MTTQGTTTVANISNRSQASREMSVSEMMTEIFRSYLIGVSRGSRDTLEEFISGHELTNHITRRMDQLSQTVTEQREMISSLNFEIETKNERIDELESTTNNSVILETVQQKLVEALSLLGSPLRTEAETVVNSETDSTPERMRASDTELGHYYVLEPGVEREVESYVHPASRRVVENGDMPDMPVDEGETEDEVVQQEQTRPTESSDDQEVLESPTETPTESTLLDEHDEVSLEEVLSSYDDYDYIFEDVAPDTEAIQNTPDPAGPVFIKNGDISENFNCNTDDHMNMYVFARYAHLDYHYTLNGVRYKLKLEGSRIVPKPV